MKWRFSFTSFFGSDFFQTFRRARTLTAHDQRPGFLLGLLFLSTSNYKPRAMPPDFSSVAFSWDVELPPRLAREAERETDWLWRIT